MEGSCNTWHQPSRTAVICIMHTTRVASYRDISMLRCMVLCRRPFLWWFEPLGSFMNSSQGRKGYDMVWIQQNRLPVVMCCVLLQLLWELDNGRSVGLSGVADDLLRSQLQHVLELLGLKCTKVNHGTHALQPPPPSSLRRQYTHSDARLLPEIAGCTLWEFATCTAATSCIPPWWGWYTDPLDLH